MRRFFYPAAFLFLFFAVWEFFSWNSGLRFVMPPPSAAVKQLYLQRGRLLFHAGITFYEMLGGAAIAFAFAFPLAWMMAFWRMAGKVLQPAFLFLQCVPMFVFAPIMVIWFGWSYMAVAVPTALMVVFPLTLCLYRGIRETPQELIDYFVLNRATAWQTFWKLEFPWSLPFIFTGLRIAASGAGIGAVAGEWAGAQAGLGLLMLESRRSADIETSFAALFCIAALTLFFYGAVIALERGRGRRSGPLFAVAAGSLALLFFSTGFEAPPKREGEVRLVLDWLPNPNHVPFYAGLEKGFFEEQGVALSILKMADPASPLSYLASGQSELALYYMPDTVRAEASGAEVEVAGVLIGAPLRALIFRAGEGIASPQDLSGKVIGYCLDGAGDNFLDRILLENRIFPKKRLNVSFDLVGPLGTKSVDATYGGYWNIEGEYLKSLGIETGHFPVEQLGVPHYCELIVLAKKGADPRFLAAFRQALQRSIDYCKQYPEEGFAAYLRANPDKSEKVRAWERRAWEKSYPLLASEQQIPASVWSALSQWMALRSEAISSGSSRELSETGQFFLTAPSESR